MAVGRVGRAGASLPVAGADALRAEPARDSARLAGWRGRAGGFCALLPRWVCDGGEGSQLEGCSHRSPTRGASPSGFCAEGRSQPAPMMKVGESLRGVAFEIRRCYTLALFGRTAIPPSAVEIEGKKPRYASILSACSAWLPHFCTNAGRARFRSSPWKATRAALPERGAARCRRRKTGWRRADEPWPPPGGQLSPRRNSCRAPLQGREGPGFAGEAAGQARAGRRSARMPGITSSAALPAGTSEVIE